MIESEKMRISNPPHFWATVVPVAAALACLASERNWFDYTPPKEKPPIAVHDLKIRPSVPDISKTYKKPRQSDTDKRYEGGKEKKLPDGYKQSPTPGVLNKTDWDKKISDFRKGVSGLWELGTDGVSEIWKDISPFSSDDKEIKSPAPEDSKDLSLDQRVDRTLSAIDYDPKGTRIQYLDGMGIDAVKKGSIDDQIEFSAERYGFDPELSHKIAKKESDLKQLKDGKPHTSKKGAVGLYQIMPGRAAFRDMFDLTFNPGRQGAEKKKNLDVHAYVMNIIKPNLEGVLGGEMSQDIGAIYLDRQKQSGTVSSADIEIRKAKRLKKKKGQKWYAEKVSKNKVRKLVAKRKLETLNDAIEFFHDSAWEKVKWDYAVNAEIGNSYHAFLAIKASKGNPNLNAKALTYSLSCANAGERHVKAAKGLPDFKETNRYVDLILNEGYLADKGIIVAIHGATPFGISKKYGVPLKDFIRMNSLKGKQMQAGNVYRIRRGADTNLIAYTMPNFK